MTQQRISDRYTAYIASINSDTMESELPKYCQAHVIHNNRHLSLEQYRLMIQDSKDAIPDLMFHIDTILYDEVSQKLAVRLEFTGTPISNVAGIESIIVNEKQKHVSFSEHVFYQLRDEKIEQIWSIVDWEAVRMQLKSTSPHQQPSSWSC